MTVLIRVRLYWFPKPNSVFNLSNNRKLCLWQGSRNSDTEVAEILDFEKPSDFVCVNRGSWRTGDTPETPFENTLFKRGGVTLWTNFAMQRQSDKWKPDCCCRIIWAKHSRWVWYPATDSKISRIVPRFSVFDGWTLSWER